MPDTVANQKLVIIHREAPTSNFLGILNENWQAACRDLGAHATILYLYLASNKNNFELALSPKAVENAIGMPRSTYYDQLKKLTEKGYLIQERGNKYHFYEVAQKKNKSEDDEKEGDIAKKDKECARTSAGLGVGHSDISAISTFYTADDF